MRKPKTKADVPVTMGSQTAQSPAAPLGAVVASHPKNSIYRPSLPMVGQAAKTELAGIATDFQ